MEGFGPATDDGAGCPGAPMGCWDALGLGAPIGCMDNPLPIDCMDRPLPIGCIDKPLPIACNPVLLPPSESVADCPKLLISGILDVGMPPITLLLPFGIVWLLSLVSGSFSSLNCLRNSMVFWSCSGLHPRKISIIVFSCGDSSSFFVSADKWASSVCFSRPSAKVIV